MKAFGATVPGTKLRLLARGSGTSSGKSVAKPAGVPLLPFATVALPTSAFALAGIVMLLAVKEPGRVSVWPAVSVAFGRDEGGRPGRVSNSRTGAARGWK